jgi:hypothetical protein
VLLLEIAETPEDNSFTMGETVCHIWQIITRITVRHVRLLYIATRWDVHQ